MKKMSILAIGFCLSMIFFFLVSMSNSPKAIANRQVAERAQLEKTRIYNVVAGYDLGKKMEYFMDPRPTPPQCFGYLWLGEKGAGGPALASVPCDAVKDLIKNGVSQPSW